MTSDLAGILLDLGGLLLITCKQEISSSIYSSFSQTSYISHWLQQIVPLKQIHQGAIHEDKANNPLMLPANLVLLLLQ
jgi:hypothetical protein